MLNLKNTLDGYLKNVEVIGNTIQDTNNLANIRSVGDKVEGQELYKIPVVNCGKNLFDGVLINKAIDVETGALADSPSWYTTNYIKTNSDKITFSTSTPMSQINNLNFTIVMFDKSYNVLGNTGFYNNNTGTWTLNPNTKYIRVRLPFANYSNIQIEEGTQVTPYEPYQESKLEILSPVQLEKVGDVADRIICKDGVWGVEKNITKKLDLLKATWNRHVETDNNLVCKTSTYNDVVFKEYGDKIISNFTTSIPQAWNGQAVGISTFNDGWIYLCVPKNLVPTIDNLSTYLNNVDAYAICRNSQPQFIPLPHDQQVKLRTFAGQTNIAFLTEIPGQIKAQVPKSLGATVNTHTEQIADLHNSLDRVKKLEETTVSTVETGSNFTAVNETSNGYFEDVKLEGKTLVNLCPVSSIEFTKTVENQYTFRECVIPQAKRNTVYTICVNVTANQSTNSTTLFTFINNTGEGATGNMRINGTGYFVSTLKTLDIEFSRGVAFRFASSNSGNLGLYKCENLIILEGDHTNNPPEFFEGLMSVGQDVEEVSVESVDGDGNLFDGTLFTGYVNNGVANSWDSHFRTDYISVVGGAEYYSYMPEGASTYTYVQYDKNKNFICNKYTYNSNDNNKFVTDSNCRYVIITSSKESATLNELSCTLKLYKDKVSGKPHQSNKKPLLYFNPTTETWEKPVLREWDTIEKHSDGKYYYHKRSGEVVLNGSEGTWGISGINHDSKNILRFFVNIDAKPTSSNDIEGYIISDTFTTNTYNGMFDLNVEGIAITQDSKIGISILKSKLTTQDVAGFKAWMKANPVTVVYHSMQEEIYECTNIDLMTYSGETNYIINSGAISPKSLLKVHNNISNVVKILQEKVSLLENTFIAGLKSVLSGDMYSLATILYPEDFEQNDNTEQDIMVIPE